MPKKWSTPRGATPQQFRKDPATQGILDTAYSLQKAGNLQQAELLYQKVLAAEPGNPFAIYALGSIALFRGDQAGAVPLLRHALAAGYEGENVYTQLGIALQSMGRAEEAMEVYQAGIKKDPRNPRYPSNVSVLLAQKGDFEGALQMAQHALKLNPKFAPACMNAGFHLQSLGRLVQAAEMFERAARLQPHNTEVREALEQLKKKLATQAV